MKIIDISGETFGYLTAIECVGRDKSGGALWKCVCVCGKEVTVTGGNLRSGKQKSCGCKKGALQTEELTGKRFGKLIVVAETEPYISPSGNKAHRWLCECDCGEIKIAKGADLKSGKVDNCGCQTWSRRSKAKTKDIVGRKFGKLTVIRYSGIKNKHSSWECKCDCGKTVIVASDSLKSGHAMSCGCLRIKDLSNKKFGRLLVKKYVAVGTNGAIWECLCDCGEVCYVSSSGLLSGHTKSCGCLVKESHPSVHNKSGTRLYNIWRGMKERCYNENTVHYNSYGGRGIVICDEWTDNFVSFYNWAIQNGYSDNLTIDRIDNNGNYEPSNCRWTTQKEQMNNTRSNHLITFNGKTQTIAQWSEELGINYQTIQGRIRRGLPVPQILSKDKLY